MISKNNTLFYRYNNRKITLEEFCTRTCENPFKITYNYNNENLLIEKYHQNLEFLLEKNRYDEKKNLIEKKLGKDSLGKSFQYFYDSKNRLTSRKEKEFNKALPLVQSIRTINFIKNSGFANSVVDNLDSYLINKRLQC